MSKQIEEMEEEGNKQESERGGRILFLLYLFHLNAFTQILDPLAIKRII